MLSPVEELKIRSKILLKQQPTANSPLLALSKGKIPQLKHALLFVARQSGFNDWQHALTILSCEQSLTEQQDSGKFWYAQASMTLLNHWCANYQEALTLQAQKGGVVLPYKKQFVVADSRFLQSLGLAVNDPLWESLKYNWCQGPQAIRQQLAYKRLLAMQLAPYKAC
ncbi:hypothetical protein M0C34_12360 [Agarivorans sp. TSD2052]|uniref:hypothetical protein n=1 Tax=Agarivorans sp. TSD2052 TaxID=2937286 RepID=UPI00200ED134|nr:hypothetical protein [Agarivorans sp. TSD2052]UPW17040.1 hypothetical protein M0C34_12360 [Agarivorans sp. TSD2052]